MRALPGPLVHQLPHRRVGEVRVHVRDRPVRPLQLHAAYDVRVARGDAAHQTSPSRLLRVRQDFDAALAHCAVADADALLAQTVEHVVRDRDDRRLHRVRRQLIPADLQRELGVLLTIYDGARAPPLPKTAKSTTPREMCSAIRLWLLQKSTMF